jgi:hypothetical protein
MQDTGFKGELCAQPQKTFISLLTSHMSKTLNVLMCTRGILAQELIF